MKKPKSNLAWNFRSISWPDYGTYPHMLQEDLGNYIAPLSGRSQNFKDFTFYFDGNVDEIDQAIKILSSFKNRPLYKDTNAIVSDFLNNVAKNIFTYGRARLELSNNNLTSITPQRMIVLPFYVLQIVPKADVDFYGSRILIVRSNKIWTFTLSDNQFSTAYKLRLFILSKANEITPKKLFKESILTKSKFDLKHYTLLKYQFINALTKKYNWTIRSSISSEISEYYLVHRHLKKHLYKSQLRIHLINQLNNHFKRLGLKVVLKESGLPCPSQIQQDIDNLKEGLISFEVSEKYSFT